MAYPSVTHTFVTATDLDATQVNTNFTNIIEGITNGAKDLKVADITSTEIDVTVDISTGTTLSAAEITANALIIGTCTTTDLILELLSLTKESKTLAADSMTPAKSLVEINGEAGAADNLSTITATAFSNGDLLFLFRKSTSGDITIKNNTGNILCGSDRILSEHSTALLIYDGTATKWNLIFYQSN